MLALRSQPGLHYFGGRHRLLNARLAFFISPTQSTPLVPYILVKHPREQTRHLEIKNNDQEGNLWLTPAVQVSLPVQRCASPV